MNLLDLLFFSIIFLLMAGALTLAIILAFRNKRLSSVIIQLQIDKKIISDKLEEVAMAMQVNELEQTDGFLKFVSDSRDWAFSYIENVQEQITKFSDIVEPQIKRYESKIDSSNYSEILNNISRAYKDLITLLPNEEKK